MEIKILQLLEGAECAKGLTVVIDVFRAFSLACYIFEKNPAKYYAVSDIHTAYRMKKENPSIILVGERNERIPENFDFGNSPTHILHVNLEGKTIVHTTSAGTQGLLRAMHSDEILTGSFVNARAIANYILKQKPDVCSLVCMGYAATYPTDEDTFCAEYIKSIIEGQLYPLKEKIEIIKQTSGSRLFLPENQTHSPETDFYLCTDYNRFNFIIKAEKVDTDLVELRKMVLP